jgi:UDP-glucose 4-epimerase
VAERARLEPISPYGSSKLMTEIMPRAVGVAHALRYVTLRYFNVAGADPLQVYAERNPSDQGGGADRAR